MSMTLCASRWHERDSSSISFKMHFRICVLALSAGWKQNNDGRQPEEDSTLDTHAALTGRSWIFLPLCFSSAATISKVALPVVDASP